MDDDASGFLDGGPIAGEFFGADLEVFQVFDARLFELLANARQFHAHDPRYGNHAGSPLLTPVLQVFLMKIV